MLIYLIGMPASGKSTFGKLVAQKLNYTFLDLDTLIEEDNNSTIPKIFDTKGEDFFRKLEQNALQFTFNLDKTIIATGGGTPCFFDNLDKMKENGIVCFIHIEIKTLVKRTFQAQQRKQNSRPLFKDSTSFEELYQLVSQKWTDRKEFYQKADFEIKNNDLNEFLEKLNAKQ
ncbi:shikimate kinase [Bernardetia litoralis DSM 6794]|uniref:Shikimate kinase n=1 Tax=Bernardetia litoralis (strain ATCC 23117 / DSM 6794 / NBRC 15988 / NCIMB 1366 / Fx l1 / Sio-4) TaxID=880071 RepID=I4AF46_BERLS|nr:shikimate kinase [Bernardetia litoralis]AFM02581.1 shikimate kinase [Bernardetia litoralis DSM 6794]